MTYSNIRPMADSTPEESEKFRRKAAAQLATSNELLAAPEQVDPAAAAAQQPANPAPVGEADPTERPAEPNSAAAGESPGQSAIKEVGSAVVGGLADAVQGIGSNLNQAVRGVTGQEVKMGEDYTPDWLKPLGDIAPQNKTWWGGAVRGMVQLSALSVLAAKGGKAAGVKPAATWIGKAGQSAVTGAVAGNLSTFSTDEHNLTRMISDAVPWFPNVLATRDDDSPMMNRLKNTLEGAGFDVAFDAIAAGWRGRKLAVNAEVRAGNDQLREKAIEARQEGSNLAQLQTAQREARKQMDVAQVAREAARGTELEAETAATFTAAQESHKAARKQYNAAKKAATPEEIQRVATEDSLKERTKLREDNETEAALYEYNKDPNFENGPNPRSSNPDLFDKSDAGLITAKPNIRENTEKALKDAVRIDADPVQAKGRLSNIVTEPKLKMMLEGGSPAVRKVLNEMIDSIQRGDHSLTTDINGLKVSKQQSINLVATQAYKVLEHTANPEDLDGLKQFLLSDSWKGNVNGVPAEFMDRVNTAATQLLIRVTSEELADLSNVYRSYEATGIVDTRHLGNLLTDRLEFLLKEHKKAAYIRGSELQSMQKNWAAQFLPNKKDYGQAIVGIDKEIDQVIGTIRGSVDSGDTRLLNHFITAASISDGSVRTLADLAAYMKKKVGFHGFLHANPEDMGYQLQGLTATFYNSVLSSPKTAIRAWAGTGLITLLRPTTMMLGGALRGDARIVAKSFAQFNALREGYDDAVKMMKKSKNAWVGGDPSLNNGILGKHIPYHKTDDFKALKSYAEQSGDVGLQAGVKHAEQLSAFNSNVLVNYGVGMMDAGDSFFRTLIGRMEMKSQAFDEAWNTTGGKVNGEMVRAYEETFRSKIFDEDGVVTDVAAQMAGNEATLTAPLDGIGKGLTQVIQSIPLLRPFVMFPKTAMNASELMMKHTPILNGFVKEVNEVMNATIDTAPGIMQKYGITDLAAAQAQIEGRVALGNVVMMGAVSMYLSGAVTGNGPADKTTRDLWQQTLGWQPRSIRIGDKWVSYEGLEPFHTFLALTADIGDNLGDLGESIAADGLAKLAFVVAQNATNKTFMGGLSPLMDILGGGTASAGATTAIAQTLNNVVPHAGFRNYLSQAFGPGLREVNDDIWSKIQNRNPILRQQLPLQRDPIDGSLVKAYDPLTNLYNWSIPYQVNPDWGETREKLRQSGFDVKLSLTTDRLGKKLDKGQQAAVNLEMSKENIDGKLKTLFASKRYQEWDAALKAERARGIPAAISGLNQNWHLIEIGKIFNDAKKSAMSRVSARSGETQAVRDAQMKKVRTNAARQGNLSVTLQDINKIPK